MEPGHEDREDNPTAPTADSDTLPQWSPAIKTAKTSRHEACPVHWGNGRNGARP